MSREKAVVVAKQDSSIERFSDAKLRNCLAAVLTATRQDPNLASPLARAVAMHLADWSDREPPSSEYVFRCVQAVFNQTGLQQAARCMAVHRRRRRARRKQVQVVYPDRATASPVPWSKTRVVACLRSAHGLGPSVARLLAGEVEMRLLSLGFRFVRPALIKALIENVLMAWGLASGDVEVVVCAQPAVVVPPAAALQNENNQQE